MFLKTNIFLNENDIKNLILAYLKLSKKIEITDKINSTKKECISYNTSNLLNLNSTEQRFTNEFRSRNHLSHKISLLFTYLYSKRNLHVTLEEMKNVLSKDSKPETPNGIRLAIYRLRTILKEDVKTHFEILNYDYGYSLVENED